MSHHAHRQMRLSAARFLKPFSQTPLANKTITQLSCFADGSLALLEPDVVSVMKLTRDLDVDLGLGSLLVFGEKPTSVSSLTDHSQLIRCVSYLGGGVSLFIAGSRTDMTAGCDVWCCNAYHKASNLLACGCGNGVKLLDVSRATWRSTCRTREGSTWAVEYTSA
eukprot:c8178_g1_i2.p1 GENE.c8178_g1_i2~~c8178_g1_i2.p1  ORF type:complete len:165 (+),score=24.78 c8178_g1_i2:414-908(+)